MIKRIASTLIFGLLLTASANPALSWLVQANRTCPGGLGDLGTSYTFYWGARAYNFAYAFAGSKAFNIIRSSDSVTCDFNFDGSGQLFNMTTGSCSDGGTSNGQSPATFCNATTCKVITAYNQTGTTRDLTQATDANRPTLDFTCGKNPFCVKFASTQVLASSSYTPPSAVATLNAVGQRISGTTNMDWLVVTAAGFNILRAVQSGSGQWGALIGASALNEASTHAEGSFHAAVVTMNGASSAITVDSDTTTGTKTGSTGAGAIQITGGATKNGWWQESSYLASTGQDATARAAVISNQRACWAF